MVKVQYQYALLMQLFQEEKVVWTSLKSDWTSRCHNNVAIATILS